MVKIFQSRYYSFRDKGRALIWFKKQPSNIEERPQGFIVVEEIEKVEPDEKDKYIFYIHYPERVFKLKAVKNGQLLRNRVTTGRSGSRQSRRLRIF